MLIPESALPAFTILHVAISLAAIASGFIVVFGMIANKRLDGWNALFLATTVLTSVTGFGFPIKGMTPGIAFGIISLVVLTPVIYAHYSRRLVGVWRPVYIIGAMLAFYLNFVVLIVQSFQKVPALKALAPTQSEPPFLVTQVVAMVAFISSERWPSGSSAVFLRKTDLARCATPRRVVESPNRSTAAA